MAGECVVLKNVRFIMSVMFRGQKRHIQRGRNVLWSKMSDPACL
jgi:hypothetical protein